MRKRGVLFAVLLVALVLSAYLVSAYSFPIQDLRTTANNVLQVIKDSLGPVFEVLIGVGQFDQYFFARVLFLILIYIIVFMVLKRIDLFNRNMAVIFIISLVVAVLGARYISEIGFIEGILLPYGVLSTALAVLLPLVIFAFFVHDSIPGTIGRRLAWIVFSIIFLTLWLMRRNEIGNANWIYTGGVIFVIVMVIFDRAIHRYFGLAEIRRATRAMTDAQRVNLLDRYHQALEVYNRTGDRAARRELERLARQLNINAGEDFQGGGGI